MDKQRLARLTYLRFFSAIPVLGLFFFLPAGTFNYWEAWLYMVVLLTPMFFAMQYLLKNDPALLERRMRMKEKESQQSLIIKLSYVYFLATFLLPGFDKRFGWSDTPVWLALLANAFVLGGYVFVMWVFKVNSYASRTVEVDSDQKVIDTGPYAWVRHPMYFGLSFLYVLSPLALGSYWTLILSVWIIPLLVARILNEEKVLANELPGYREYQQKVRYRLFPWVW